MKKKKTEHLIRDTDMLPEYDFRGKKGVRGKYAKAYQQGHTVRINKPDGSVIIQNFTLEEGVVIIEPDVRQFFPDSESVNSALRLLITLIPKQKRTTKSRRSVKP